ncbi:cytochrome ubiquinol oxidase subunit I [Rhodoplanes roseus]|uniref:Cytochrome ubiquinol oxidase subunit I n=1 Tax=Rhodoplanes roseus TaxID=29409 RepID=A0A327KV27_9BRAD|nr:cytochrome ubiquinol oxidase subunit I [Rhodoplanes roseus]RAI41593.1 cytochrome ubiquinol oxidase subunit I [Rhodoplanes roseus]
MDFDPLLLARVQFAFTITFHIIFPSFTIGLSAYIATLLVLRQRTGDERYGRLAQFWTKIFAVSFALGVVSGLVLSYQFGTNWSRFSVVVGNVIGPMIGYEVLTAFFLEASFLGILLFGGGGRVPPLLHTLSAVIVAAGTATSAFWILSANSWMQTPAGHVMIDGVAHPQDWLAIIFNPSFPYRLAHMVTAAYLTTAFVVLAVGARWVLAERHYDEARLMVRMAIGMIIVLAPLQIFIGDQHGLNTLKHQPAKIAAMEGHWDGSKPGNFEIFAWPDSKTESNRVSISIPYASSLILTHDPNGLFPGLKDFPPEDRPPVPNVFFAFRIMLAIGFSMLGIAVAGAVLWWRGSMFTTGWFLKLVSHTWWFGFTAIVAGWIVTESGRQPWIAYGILRTADATSPVPGGSIAATLALFVLVYGMVFSMGIYFINRLLANGLAHGADQPPRSGTPLRPQSAAGDASRRAL